MNNHHLTSSNEKQMFIDSIMDAMAALFEKYDEKDGYTCFQYDENEEIDDRSFIIKNVLTASQRAELADRIYRKLNKSPHIQNGVQLDKSGATQLAKIISNKKLARRKAFDIVNKYFTDDLHYHMFM